MRLRVDKKEEAVAVREAFLKRAFGESMLNVISSKYNLYFVYDDFESSYTL